MTRRLRIRIATRALAVIGMVIGLGACGSDSATGPAPSPAPAPTPSPEPEPTVPEMVTYDIVFQAHLSSDPLLQLRGAVPFPESVGLSPYVALVAHPERDVLWEEGEVAPDELKELAETGDSQSLVRSAGDRGFRVIARLDTELQALIRTAKITLTTEYPCVSYAQAIAPSPDWFLGFSACAMVDGAWIREVTFTAVAYDAGTAMGDDFISKAVEADTEPRQSISLLNVAPFSPAGTPVSTIRGTLRAN